MYLLCLRCRARGHCHMHCSGERSRGISNGAYARLPNDRDRSRVTRKRRVSTNQQQPQHCAAFVDHLTITQSPQLSVCLANIIQVLINFIQTATDCMVSLGEQLDFH